MYFEPDMLAPSAVHRHFGACMHFASETSKYAKLNEVEPTTDFIKQELTIPCKTSSITYPDW